MVQYVREGQERFCVNRNEQIVGAILHHRRNPCEVDVWRLCYDLSQMLRHDSRDVIYGATEDEIESEIWKRHPVEGSGVSLVTKAHLGWQIERSPRLMHADLNLLHEACAIHKRILVGNELIQELGGEQKLISLGFLLEDRSSRQAQLIRYNPRQVAVNCWKRQVQKITRYLQPQFPSELVGELFDAVKPEYWQEQHPYRGLLKTGCEVVSTQSTRHSSRGSRRRGRHCFEQANLTNAPDRILTLVQIAAKLSRGEHSKPWRQGCQWKELLERLVEYLHGVEQSGDENWKKLAKWVRAEARAAMVKIPRKRKLPPRPTSGKKAANSQAIASQRLEGSNL